MNFYRFFLLIFTLIAADAVSMRGTADAVSEAKEVTGLINANTPEANKLRTNLSMLAGKLNSFGGATPASLGDKNKAQQIAATIDSIVNTIIGTSVLSSVQTAESIKGSVSVNSYLSALFIQQGGNVSVWEAFIYPPVLTHLIRIQASYAAAMLNYISQHIDRLKPEEIQSMNSIVESMLNRLNSLA